MLKILYYNPGEYLASHYMLFVPMLFTLFFWFLRKRLKSLRDIGKGGEIYLYKYRSSRALSQLEWDTERLRLETHRRD
jgi:hypothetical protein